MLDKHSQEKKELKLRIHELISDKCGKPHLAKFATGKVVYAAGRVHGRIRSVQSSKLPFTLNRRTMSFSQHPSTEEVNGGERETFRSNQKNYFTKPGKLHGYQK